MDRIRGVKEISQVFIEAAEDALSLMGAHVVAVVVCVHEQRHTEEKGSTIICAYPKQDHFLVPLIREAIDKCDNSQPKHPMI